MDSRQEYTVYMEYGHRRVEEPCVDGRGCPGMRDAKMTDDWMMRDTSIPIHTYNMLYYSIPVHVCTRVPVPSPVHVYRYHCNVIDEIPTGMISIWILQYVYDT